jgi:predicted O-methyltransferase YrrM
MIRRWFRDRQHARVLRADAYATQLLIAPLAARLKGYIPWTGHALRPFALATLLNDLVVNPHAAYLEFGAGVSTLFTAKVAALNGLALEMTCIEHDQGWMEVVRAMLATEGLAGRVRFVHCPLVDPIERPPFGPLRWYDEQVVVRALSGQRYDLVLVDGPPAGNASMNRYPAVPVLRAHGFLADEATVFLDDVHRRAERRIARAWSAHYGLKFEMLHGRVAYAAPKGRFAPMVE